MANAIFVQALGGFLDGVLAWSADNVKAALIDLDPWALAVTDATNANPIVVTTASPHNLNDGDTVNITGVVGNVPSNGLHVVAVVSPLEIELVGASGNGAYVSGGYVVDLTAPLMLDDIPSSAIVATSLLLENKHVDGSIAYADPIRFDDVTGPVVRAVILYKDTGNPVTSRLITYFDRGNGLPLTPNGFPVQLNWNEEGLFGLSQ